MSNIYLKEEVVKNILELIKDQCERICGHFTGEHKKDCIRECRKSIINIINEKISMDNKR